LKGKKGREKEREEGEGRRENRREKRKEKKRRRKGEGRRKMQEIGNELQGLEYWLGAYGQGLAFVQADWKVRKERMRRKKEEGSREKRRKKREEKRKEVGEGRYEKLGINCKASNNVLEPTIVLFQKWEFFLLFYLFINTLFLE
jgi:hypothetical protein